MTAAAAASTPERYAGGVGERLPRPHCRAVGRGGSRRPSSSARACAALSMIVPRSDRGRVPPSSADAPRPRRRDRLIAPSIESPSVASKRATRSARLCPGAKSDMSSSAAAFRPPSSCPAQPDTAHDQAFRRRAPRANRISSRRNARRQKATPTGEAQVAGRRPTEFDRPRLRRQRGAHLLHAFVVLAAEIFPPLRGGDFGCKFKISTSNGASLRSAPACQSWRGRLFKAHRTLARTRPARVADAKT